MRGTAKTRLLIAFAVAGLVWLALSGLGLLDFGALGDGGEQTGMRDPLAEFENELFAEIERNPGLKGLPGMEHRVLGEGVVRGTVLVHIPGQGQKPLPGVQVHVIGSARGSKQRLPELESGADGVFAFTDVPAGSGYVLIIDHAPYRRVVLRGLNVGRDRTTDVGNLVLGAPTSLSGEVFDAKGRPVRGAQVQVLRDTSRQKSFDLRRALFELQATDTALAQGAVGADGRFLLKDLPPGRFVLRVSAPGHATTFRSGVLVTLDEQSSAVRVVLDPGAGFHGRVLDESGRGLAGARVIAVAMPGRKLERFDRVEAETDAAGEYRLDTLIPGMTYGLEAWAEGYAPTGTYLREIEGFKKRDWKLKRTGRIEGRVTDAETGAGVADCQITVLAGPLSGVSPVSTTTDPSGGFVLPHVNPGPILLFSAKAEGYQPGGRFNLAAVQGQKVAAGETTWVDWTLEAGGAVVGRVTSDGGRAVPYAELALVDRDRGRRRLNGEITAVSEADGTFLLTGVQPGKYDLRVSAPGFAPPTDPEATLLEMPQALGEIRKDIALARGAILDGTVLSPDGDPVRGARVWIEAESGSVPQDTLRDLTAVSSGTGQFRLSGVPPTAGVRVFADHDAYVRSMGERARLTPGSSGRVTVRLRAGVKLPGRVVDVRGVAVADARVRWGNVDGVRERDLRNSFDADAHLGSRVVRTDEDGRFLLTGLPPGTLLLKVEKEGFSSWYRRDKQIGEEGLQPAITVELEGTLTVRGRVTAGDTGRPLARAFVYARERAPVEGQDPDPGRVQAVVSTETDADGRYVLDKVPPGLHDIVVWFAEGYIGGAQQWRNANVRKREVPAGATGIDFALDPIKPPETEER